jgi:hypothetical protein
MKYFYAVFIGVFSFSALAGEVEVPLKLTSDLCSEYLASQAPHKKSTTLEETNEEAVIPADFDENKVQIQISQSIILPIKLDLKKYFGLAPEETQRNHHEIKGNLEQLKEAEGGILQDLTAIEIHNKEASDNFITLKREFKCHPRKTQDVKDSFEKNLGNFKTIADLLKGLPARYEQVNSLLGKNLEILYVQLTAYEEDEMVANENIKLREQNIAYVVQALESLTKITDMFYEARKQLRKNQHFLLFNASVFGKSLDPLLAQFESLVQAFSALERAFKEGGFFEEVSSTGSEETRNETQKEILEELKNRFIELNRNKENFINYLEAGEVEYIEGKFYLNGQSLNEKEKLIKNACKKLNS